MENPVACRLESCHLGHLMIKACTYCEDLHSSQQLSLCGKLSFELEGPERRALQLK